MFKKIYCGVRGLGCSPCQLAIGHEGQHLCSCYSKDGAEINRVEEILSGLFVQAPGGVITNAPTKIAHLIEKAQTQLNELYLNKYLELLPKEVDRYNRTWLKYHKRGYNAAIEKARKAFKEQV